MTSISIAELRKRAHAIAAEALRLAMENDMMLDQNDLSPPQLDLLYAQCEQLRVRLKKEAGNNT